MAIPEDMGLRYGRVSGDLNVVHTTRMAARVVGHPRPVVQGLCTANHVLCAPTGALEDPVVSPRMCAASWTGADE